MIDDPQSLVSAAELSAAAPELPSAGEQALPPPTAAQARAVDDVFTAPPQRDPATTLLGVLTSVMLLRDLAVDNFSKSAEAKRAEQDAKEDEDADAAD